MRFKKKLYRVCHVQTSRKARVSSVAMSNNATCELIFYTKGSTFNYKYKKMPSITGDILYDASGIIFVLFMLFYLYSKWAYQYWTDRNVPSLEPKLFWGNFQAPFRRSFSISEEVTNFYNAAKAKGWKYVGVYGLTSPIFIPIDLDIVKSIMTKNFNHFVDRGFYYNERDQPISAHLFSIGGSKWKNLRSKFTPTFTSGKMKYMFQTVSDCGKKFNAYLNDELDLSQPLDIKNILGNFSTDVIGSCAFGIECNSLKDPQNPFRIHGNRVIVLTRFENLKLEIGQNFPKLARFLRITNFNAESDAFFTKMVMDTVKYRESNNIQRNDFMQLLIDIKNNTGDAKQEGQGNSLTMDELVAQSFVFFAAGFETSSATSSFALFELARHQDIQDKVREEIHRVLKKYNGEITYDALGEMKYMGQVIDETLRLYPPLGIITRACVEDYVLPEVDIKIEKGTKVFIPTRAIQLDEEYYTNPEDFDPNRFSEKNKQSRNPYAHLPFGEGPRVCIGLRFGVMQVKIGLIQTLKDFKVTVNKKMKLPLKLDPFSILTKVDGDIWLNLIKIK